MTTFARQLMVMVMIAGFVFVMPPVSSGVPLVFSGSGADPASIQPTVDAFRAALGGVNNGNATGPLDTGRREINWDGGGSTATALAATPFNGFRDNRGAVFTTPGTGFVQATPAGLADTFVNPTYTSVFQSFSPQRLFAPVNSFVTDIRFFVPGTNTTTAATTTAFGAVFTNVRLADTTSIEFFNKTGGSLGKFLAPTSAAGGLSFLGIQFGGGEVISQARLTTGNTILGSNDGGSLNVVAMDDFIYREPKGSVPIPGTLLPFGVGLAGLAAWRRKKLA